MSRMMDLQAHRGPDASGIHCAGPITLGHRRLSVLDLGTAANQPMSDDTGKVSVVHNGEIYNFRELRRELESYGAVFRTESDTEVILESYKRWGIECLQNFNGMFAFALWDDDRRRLILARDRLGEKPLYYIELPEGGLAFASEMKALRIHPAVSGELNPEAISHFLALGYTLSDKPILNGVRRLAAAHFTVFEQGRTARETLYWDLAPHFHNKRQFKSQAEAEEELTAMIDDSVRLRLISDVPLGGFLSGGIDSSSIIASMTRGMDASDVKTFHIDFNEAGYSEADSAQRVAGHLGVAHKSLTVDEDMAKSLSKIIYHADEPFADTSMIPTFFLGEMTRRSVTVGLSGDGGDEILAGYETYAADRIRHWSRWIPGWVSQGAASLAEFLLRPRHAKVGIDYKAPQFLRGHGLGARRAHYSWREIMSAKERRQVVSGDYRKAIDCHDPYEIFDGYFSEVADCHYLDQAMYVDIKTWLADDILVKVDRMTMAHGLEVRAPFLDHRLVELTAAMPVNYKFRGLSGKHILRTSQADRLPAAVLKRHKEGFNAPISQWMEGSLRDGLEDVLGDKATGEILNVDYVRRLISDHRRKIRDNGYKLFAILCFGLWLRQKA